MRHIKIFEDIDKHTGEDSLLNELDDVLIDLKDFVDVEIHETVKDGRTFRNSQTGTLVTVPKVTDRRFFQISYELGAKKTSLRKLNDLTPDNLKVSKDRHKLINDIVIETYDAIGHLSNLGYDIKHVDIKTSSNLESVEIGCYIEVEKYTGNGKNKKV